MSQSSTVKRYKPQRLGKTLTAKRKRAERAAAIKAAREERKAANPASHRPPMPRPYTAAWKTFAIGAIKAAEEDAKRRKRYRENMHINYQGHRLIYSVTTLGRVVVTINGEKAAGWYGALWED